MTDADSQRRSYMPNRREFGAAVVATAVLRTARASPTVERPRKNTLMHVGGDYHGVAGSEITAERTSNTTCAME
jgi:hypothetical protein